MDHKTSKGQGAPKNPRVDLLVLVDSEPIMFQVHASAVVHGVLKSDAAFYRYGDVRIPKADARVVIIPQAFIKELLNPTKK